MSALLSLPDSINYTRRGHTAIVTLNRPDKRNALDSTSVDALLHIVEGAALDETHLLVLRGNGRSFCAGFDFSGFEDSSEGDLLLRFVRIEQLLQALHHAPYHTLALTHGPCFGAGADLVCACAVRVAAPGTTFRMPGLQFGLVLGTRRLTLRVGVDRARELLHQSLIFDAERGFAMGFLTGISPESEWEALVTQTELASALLDAPSTQALHLLTLPDTRAQDLSELTASAARPGLIERIRRFRS